MYNNTKKLLNLTDESLIFDNNWLSREARHLCAVNMISGRLTTVDRTCPQCGFSKCVMNKYQSEKIIFELIDYSIYEHTKISIQLNVKDIEENFFEDIIGILKSMMKKIFTYMIFKFQLIKLDM